MAIMERRPVLWVQDWPLTGAGLDLEFERLGFAVAGPFRQPHVALEWVDAHKPLFGVLALKYQDGPCTTIGRELQRRRLPLAILLGSPSLRPLIQAEFPCVPWIDAPAEASSILEALKHRDTTWPRAA